MKKHIDYLLNVVGPKSGGGGGYPEPTGTIEITQNGTHNVKDYAEAEVAVGPQFPVIMQITANGRYDVTDYTGVDVNVASGDDVAGKIIDRSITGAYVNNDIQNIGISAFSNCTDLTSFSGSSVTYINTDAFAGCSAFTEINTPNVKGLSQGAFRYSGIQAIDFPDCTLISSSSIFENCKSLRSVNIPRASEIGQRCFNTCTALTDVNLPGASTMKTYAFAGCTALQHIILPKVSSVDQLCFDGCSNLETADFGAQATATSGAVNYQAFRNCTKLTTLILRQNFVPRYSYDNAFMGTPIASGTGYIYVPSALIASYQAATNWATYSAQFRALEDYTVDGTTTGELDPTKI